MGKIIGIDLGTTNSCVSVFEGDRPVVLTNSEGKRTMPSVVAFTNDGELKIGDPAKRQAVTNPKNTIFSIKRLMGETYQQAQEEIGRFPYIVVDQNGFPYVEANGQFYTPQEISAMILRRIKKTAENYLGQEVTEAVITVPAYFNDNQRKATKDAGQIAGFKMTRILNEPTAAAVAYGFDKSDKDMKVAVFDIGGGTFDISILEFGGGVFEVLSTSGDTHLGGDDFDQVIIDWLDNEFYLTEGVHLKQDKMALIRLKEAAEKCKIELSSSNSAEINLPYITSVNGIPKHLAVSLSRSKFEQLASNLIKSCKEPCLKAIQNARLSKSSIDKVILVGGSSRIPAIQQFVQNFFGKIPSKNVNPDEAVAIGASIQGAIWTKEGGIGDLVFLDVTPFPIGIETSGGVMTKLLEANTTIPCKKTETFSTAVDNQTEVTIHVLQGEYPMASQNLSLGQFNLTGIAPARKGVPQIEVSFDIDSNGILKVSARDKATGKEQYVHIEGGNGLSSIEIEKMKTKISAFDGAVNISKIINPPNQPRANVNTTNVIRELNQQTYKDKNSQRKAHDVFISYSRDDKTLVMPLVERINREANTNCWIDLTGIESGAKFERKIMEAINASKIVLFMLSDSSLQSAWTEREVYYAEDENKRIIPVLVNGNKLRGWFKFHFGNVDYIDIRSEEQTRKLIRDLQKWLR